MNLGEQLALSTDLTKSLLRKGSIDHYLSIYQHAFRQICAKDGCSVRQRAFQLPTISANSLFFKNINNVGKNGNEKYIRMVIIPTRIPIEEKESWRWLDNLMQSTELLGQLSRCVPIGDREHDRYELFCSARELGTHFRVRHCVDRMIEGGKQTVACKMEDAKIQGLHVIEFQDSEGNIQRAWT